MYYCQANITPSATGPGASQPPPALPEHGAVELERLLALLGSL